MNPVDELLDFMRRALDASGRTQADVAQALGVSQPYLSMVLSGYKNPTLATVRRIWSEIAGEPHPIG